MVSAAQNSATQNLLNTAQLSTLSLGNDVAVAVASKTLDAARQQGSADVALIDDADVGGEQGGVGPGDELVAKATGLGGQLDTYA